MTSGKRLPKSSKAIKPTTMSCTGLSQIAKTGDITDPPLSNDASGAFRPRFDPPFRWLWQYPSAFGNGTKGYKGNRNPRGNFLRRRLANHGLNILFPAFHARIRYG